MIDRDGLYERGIALGGDGLADPARARPRRRRLARRLPRPLPGRLRRATASSSTRTASFEGTDELVKRGFLLARNILRPYVSLSHDHRDLRRTHLPRRRQDHRPLAPAPRAGRRLRRGRLPAGGRATTSPPSASGRSTSCAPRPSWTARTSRSARSSASRTAARPTATKVFEARRALADGAVELDMVIDIGALRSGRDADVQADIAAVVEVAHAAGAIVKVIFENAYLTDDEKVRACIAERGGRRRLRQDLDRLRAERRHARGPGAHAAERSRRTSRSRRPAACARSTRCWRSWTSA